MGHDDRLAFLERSGAFAVRHNSHEDLVPHLRGTAALLERWGARPALVDAGLCHSLYGTEYFATATLDEGAEGARDELRAVIGEEAEALVWLWCFGRRTTLASDPAEGAALSIVERRSGERVPITRRQLGDLVDLWIADTLEQLPRVPEREVATARGLLRYAPLALPAAREALEATVARWGGTD